MASSVIKNDIGITTPLNVTGNSFSFNIPSSPHYFGIISLVTYGSGTNLESILIPFRGSATSIGVGTPTGVGNNLDSLISSVTVNSGVVAVSLSRNVSLMGGVTAYATV